MNMYMNPRIKTNCKDIYYHRRQTLHSIPIFEPEIQHFSTAETRIKPHCSASPVGIFKLWQNGSLCLHPLISLFPRNKTRPKSDTEDFEDTTFILLINIIIWLLGRVISPEDRNCSYFLFRLVDYCGAGIRLIRCSVSGSYVIDDDTCLCTAWFSLFIFSSNYSFPALYHYLKRSRHDSVYIYN